MIIQELHKIQKQFGYLSSEALHEAAERMGEPICRLHEVASFFPHFKLKPPPRTEVHVCRDLACHLRGSETCRQELSRQAAEMNANLKYAEQVEVHGVSCLGRCDEPVAIMINDHVYAGQTTPQYLELISQAQQGKPIHPPQLERSPRDWNIDPYAGQATYAALRKYLQDWKDLQLKYPQYRNKNPPDLLREYYKQKPGDGATELARTAAVALQENPAREIIDELLKADLRGMGGAGFPAGEKWKSVSQAQTNPIDEETKQKCQRQNIPLPEPVKYVVCNGDESEPGTFKDRELLLRFPNLVIEGLVLGGLTTGASEGYVYIRHEYHDQILAVNEAIKDLRAQGLCGENIQGTGLSFRLHPVFVSPGGYICGEQNALLAAMEDRRAEPRNKPPSISEEGFRGQPTLLNNVETLAWVPSIYQNGGEWYARQGVRGGKGLRFVSISGDVQRPGVYEVPFGQTVRELVLDCAGGMRPGRQLKAIATSGPSSGFLPSQIWPQKMSAKFAEELVQREILPSLDAPLDILDLPLDIALFKSCRELMLGAAFVVYDDQCDLLDQALNCVEFYRNESCGKCVPCRIGSEKYAQLIQQTLSRGVPLDEELVHELGNVMREASICGLGQVVPNSIASVIRHFPQEIPRQTPTAGVNHAS